VPENIRVFKTPEKLWQKSIKDYKLIALFYYKPLEKEILSNGKLVYVPYLIYVNKSFDL
jgi:hypothetical protein